MGQGKILLMGILNELSLGKDLGKKCVCELAYSKYNIDDFKLTEIVLPVIFLLLSTSLFFPFMCWLRPVNKQEIMHNATNASFKGLVEQ